MDVAQTAGRTLLRAAGWSRVISEFRPMIDAFVSGWQRSFDDSGRSNRGDDCWFVLASLIASLILLFIALSMEALPALLSL